MNPTDEVDELLTRAGAQWRADQPSAPEPDLSRVLADRPRRWVVPALAAASVAAIAIAALIVLPGGDKQQLAGPTVAQSNQSANDNLLIRPGDTVKVSGQVIAAPGAAPVYCPPVPQTDIGYLPGKEPAPSCPAGWGVALKGLDLDRLSDARTVKGVRIGSATLVGIWGDRSIDVQEQSAPAVPAQTSPLPPLPCAAPAGGWVAKPNNLHSAAVTAFLNAHAAQLSEPALYYPEGRAKGDPVVVMVGVAHGELAALRTAFEKVYDGNLCVAPVKLSQTDSEGIQTALAKPMSNVDLGMWSSANVVGGPMVIDMLAYTEAVKAALAPIGLDNLKVEPAVRPS